jgi:hypothetical protein
MAVRRRICERRHALSQFSVQDPRKEKGVTIQGMALKIGSHPEFAFRMENDAVIPLLVGMKRCIASLLGQDARPLTRFAWVNEAPFIVRKTAERFLDWPERERISPQANAPFGMEVYLFRRHWIPHSKDDETSFEWIVSLPS